MSPIHFKPWISLLLARRTWRAGGRSARIFAACVGENLPAGLYFRLRARSRFLRAAADHFRES
jgi:hypothetical protein